MSYRLNKSDGSLLVDLRDGSIDTDSTNLTLIGRNVTGFGVFLNENFVKILENFANTAAPSNPITGQIWYDTAEGRLKIYNGEQFVVTGAPFVQPTQPQMIAGDLWVNNFTKQLSFFDGSDIQLVGPEYTAQQGRSGFQVVDVLDTQGRVRRVLKLWIAGQIVAVLSNLTFTPAPGQEIAEIPGQIQKGFSFVDSAGFRYQGTASTALTLTTGDGSTKSASQFLPADENGTTVGSLTVQNSNGVTIGISQNTIQKIVGTNFVVENQLLDHNYRVRVRSSAANNNVIDAITVRAAERRVGIFRDNPQFGLDVSGDCRISGNLTVDGDTTFINVSNLQVEDKNIELLGTPSGQPLLSKSSLDQAGIIVKTSDGDILFVYQDANESWSSSENINIGAGKEYKINGTAVLDQTTLGSTITSSSLTSVGNLTDLIVADFSFSGNSMFVDAPGLDINSAGPIQVNNQTITGLNTPIDGSDAATKIYVDDLIDSQPVILSLDVTGLNDTGIAAVINDLFPASQKAQGTIATVHTVQYSGQVGAVDVAGVANKSFIAVDSDGTQNESVLQDINFDPATGTVSLSVTRGLKRFVVSGNNWVFTSNLTSSV